MIRNKATAGLFDTIAVGDRITWTERCRPEWGTVLDVRFDHRPTVTGPTVVGATVRIDSPHLTAYDSSGWPISGPAVVTRYLRRFSPDIDLAYTPPVVEPADSPGGAR